MKCNLLNVPRIFAFVVTTLLSTQLVVAQVPDHRSLGACSLINGSYWILAQPYVFNEYPDTIPSFYVTAFNELTGTPGSSSPPHFGQVRFFAVRTAFKGEDGVWHYQWGNVLKYYPELWDIWQYQNGSWAYAYATPLTISDLDPNKLLSGLEQQLLSSYSGVKAHRGIYYYQGFYGWGPIFGHYPNLPEELGTWQVYSYDLPSPSMPNGWGKLNCGV